MRIRPCLSPNTTFQSLNPILMSTLKALDIDLVEKRVLRIYCNQFNYFSYI